MDLSAINSTLTNQTLANAKMYKQEKTVKDFQKALDEASDKVNSKDATSDDDKALKEMCEEFEKYFLREMYKSMRKTVNTDNFMIYGGQSEDIFQDFLDEQYIDGAVKAGGIGLAKQMYEQLKSPYSATGSKMINDAKANEAEANGEDEIKTEEIK